jgi:hypothetical protein
MIYVGIGCCMSSFNAICCLDNNKEKAKRKWGGRLTINTNSTNYLVDILSSPKDFYDDWGCLLRQWTLVPVKTCHLGLHPTHNFNPFICLKIPVLVILFVKLSNSWQSLTKGFFNLR